MKATKGIQWISWQQEAMKGVLKLRYASGSCLIDFDPEIPEWGNPASVMTSHHGVRN